jgi:hypothetical protein
MYWGAVDLNSFRADVLRRVDWRFYAFAMSVPFRLLNAVTMIAVDWLIDPVARSRLCSRSRFEDCC